MKDTIDWRVQKIIDDIMDTRRIKGTIVWRVQTDDIMIPTTYIPISYNEALLDQMNHKDGGTRDIRGTKMTDPESYFCSRLDGSQIGFLYLNYESKRANHENH